MGARTRMQGQCPGCGKGLLRAPFRDGLNRPFCSICANCNNEAILAGDASANEAKLVHLSPGEVFANGLRIFSYAHNGREDCSSFSVCSGCQNKHDLTTTQVSEVTCLACYVANRSLFETVPSHPLRGKIKV
jgi:protein-arginine kinase activator protein McsA